MVQLQLLCGGRLQDIDRTGEVWIATMPKHKTASYGATHRLFLGPQGQAILAPYLLRRPAGTPVFSPRESSTGRREVGPMLGHVDQRRQSRWYKRQG